jgi:short-subunit dehydrogenase
MAQRESQNQKQFAVVTGASSGIGLELAKVFARNGYDLLICADQSDVMQAANEIEREGAKVDGMQVDLSKPEGVTAFYSRIKSMNRPIDAIALNAGIGVNGDFARETDLDQELTLIDLNVRSVVHLAKLVLEDMVAQKHGKVLFTSSIAAMMAGSYEAVYNGSKAFIQSFAQAIREELKDSGVTVTALQPGPTDTNFFDRAGFKDTRVSDMKKDDPADVAQEGFDALMTGKDHVISGSFMNKVMSAAGKILPETVGSKAHRHLSEPGTGKH